MAATASPRRCVLRSRRLLYHRTCQEQSDLMLTVSVTFCVCAHPPVSQEAMQALLPEAGAESCLPVAPSKAGIFCQVAKRTHSTRPQSAP